MDSRIYLEVPPTGLDALIQRCAQSTLLCHPFTQTVLWWGRNFNRLSIAYAIGPRLRSRLTLSGRAFLRKPWAFGGQDSHLPYRYSYRHSHFPPVHLSLRSGFCPVGTLPYHFSSWSSVIGSWLVVGRRLSVVGLRYQLLTTNYQLLTTDLLLTTDDQLPKSAASVPSLAPDIFGAGSLDQ